MASSAPLIVYVFVVILSSFCQIYAVLNDSSNSAIVSSDLSVLGSKSSTPAMTGGLVSSSTPTVSTEFKRVCRGTNTGLGHSVGHYHEYRTRFTNCTYVDGNLEIMFIDQPDFDLSFLKDIREVTGYVLIVANYVSYLNLTSLRVIRGRSLYEHEGRYYSLYVALNYDSATPGVGLKELQFVSLQEILAGSVFFFENTELRYEDTVAWDDIVTGEGAQVIHKPSTTLQRVTSGVCDSSCSVLDKTPCWGTGPEFCQKLTKLSCSPQCDGRCFGPSPNQCCNPECAGGCTGPTKSQCWACKNFDNNEFCERFCPPEYIYSPVLFQRVRNPLAKFAYGSLCVDKCPSHLMADQGSCVQDCGAGRIANKDQICSDCDGPCPKTCTFPYDIINSENILNLTDCTIVQGHIKIQDVSFDGDPYMNVAPMHINMLHILETIQEVTDYVQVQANHYKFRSLSYLKNLEVIQGRNLGNARTSLQVFQTSLEMLGLVSLREVRFGHIYIANNSRLCYASSVRWDNLRSEVAQKVIVQFNRNATVCANDNEICSPECSDSGCWGPSDDQCISCRNYRLGKQCLNRCEAVQGVYTFGPSECRLCHPECKNNCTGDTADKCDECRNAKDGPYCVSSCPDSKYRDENGICQLCHENCEVGKGCTGPRNSVGDGACQSCSLVLLNDDNSNVTRCLPQDSNCDDGYYKQNYHRLPGAQACRRCDSECRTCSGPGLSFCTSCVHYKQENRCVEKCSQDYFVVPSYNGEDDTCEQCDARCLRCTGPTSSDCIACKQYRVYADGKSADSEQRFNCSEKCPDYAPHKNTITVDGDTETVCVADDVFEKTKQGIIIGTVVGVFVLLTFVTAAVIIFLVQRRRAKNEELKLAKQMSGFDETVPLSPTDAKPDMSILKLIKESELRIGHHLGSGAFGTVHRGFWIPDSGERIAVAIKVLSEGTTACQNTELLEEARIMASVIHPCCVQIRAVCMTARIMLVSELMPMGCLLDHVRKNGDTLSSYTLLLWSKQIAQGMNHLETKGIVHRDLAARNVLVQNLRQVKITDFGLAKLLEYKEDQFFASGGKMPIKWLALECIQHRKFTHKSDVWSFGITLWELYTYGQRPYENIRAMELPDLLSSGYRLAQPAICTIDVWMWIIKCWLVDAAERPSFSDLVEEFEKMQRDPKRYLCIGVDNKLNNSNDGSLHGNDTRLSSASDRYLQPRALKAQVNPSGKETDDGTDYVLGNNPNGSTSFDCHPRPHGVQQRHMSTSGNQRSGSSNPARTSLRYCSEPSVHAAASNAANQSQDGATSQPTEDDEYMQPVVDGATGTKYIDIYEVEAGRSVRGTIDEEGDCDDDGFDSETMTITPAVSNEYYNSLERLNPDNLPLKNIPAAKRLPLRGNSESIGSLDTDESDHDYYNELPAIVTPLVSLDPKFGGTAKWSSNGNHMV